LAGFRFTGEAVFFGFISTNSSSDEAGAIFLSRLAKQLQIIEKTNKRLKYPSFFPFPYLLRSSALAASLLRASMPVVAYTFVLTSLPSGRAPSPRSAYGPARRPHPLLGRRRAPGRRPRPILAGGAPLPRGRVPIPVGGAPQPDDCTPFSASGELLAGGRAPSRRTAPQPGGRVHPGGRACPSPEAAPLPGGWRSPAQRPRPLTGEQRALPSCRSLSLQASPDGRTLWRLHAPVAALPKQHIPRRCAWTGAILDFIPLASTYAG
jgi:hypothetical protein